MYIEKLLRKEADTFGLISSSAFSLPYAIAPTEKEWNAWNIGRRRASEWQRAKRVRQKVLSDTGIDIATKTILLWYRLHGFAPNPPLVLYVDHDDLAADSEPMPLAKKSYTMKALNRLCFCKYCGAVHAPLEDFMGRQRDCGRRQKATVVSSWSPCPAVLAPPALLPGYVPTASTLAPAVEELRAGTTAVERLSAGMDARAYHAAHLKFFPFIRAAVERQGAMLDRRPSVKPLTESILLAAALRFIRELIDATAEECRRQEVEDQPEQLAHFRVLVPLHLFKAVCKGPKFDFLTNAGLLRPAQRRTQ